MPPLFSDNVATCLLHDDVLHMHSIFHDEDIPLDMYTRNTDSQQLLMIYVDNS